MPGPALSFRDTSANATNSVPTCILAENRGTRTRSRHWFLTYKHSWSTSEFSHGGGVCSYSPLITRTFSSAEMQKTVGKHDPGSQGSSRGVGVGGIQLLEYSRVAGKFPYTDLAPFCLTFPASWPYLPNTLPIPKSLSWRLLLGEVRNKTNHKQTNETNKLNKRLVRASQRNKTGVKE